MSPIGAGHQQLGQLLLQAGVIDELQLRSALGHQRQWGGRLGRILLELKFIDEGTLASTLAKQLGLESTRIQPDVDPKILPFVPQTVAERYWIFPVSFKDGRGGGELTVAVADPTNLAAVEDIRFHTGKRIKIVVAPEGDIEAAIKRFYYGDATVPLPAGGAVPAAPIAAAPADEEIVELEPLAGELEGDPLEAPAAAGDPLADYFDGLNPSAPSSEPSFDLSAPVLDPEAHGEPQAPAGFEPPPPLQIGGSVFDAPQAGGIFDVPTRPGGAVPAPPPAAAAVVAAPPRAQVPAAAPAARSVPPRATVATPTPGVSPLAPRRPRLPTPPPATVAIPTETQPVAAMVVPPEAFPPGQQPAAAVASAVPVPAGDPAHALFATGFDASALPPEEQAVDVAFELTPPPVGPVVAEGLAMPVAPEGEQSFDMGAFDANFQMDAGAVPDVGVPSEPAPLTEAVAAPESIDPAPMVMSAAAAALAEPEPPAELPLATDFVLPEPLPEEAPPATDLAAPPAEPALPLATDFALPAEAAAPAAFEAEPPLASGLAAPPSEPAVPLAADFPPPPDQPTELAAFAAGEPAVEEAPAAADIPVAELPPEPPLPVEAATEPVPPEPTVAPVPPRADTAATASPDAVPPAPPSLDGGELTEGELQILDSLEARVATAGEPAQIIKPGELVSALIRLMIRRGLLTEAELIEELQKR